MSLRHRLWEAADAVPEDLWAWTGVPTEESSVSLRVSAGEESVVIALVDGNAEEYLRLTPEDAIVLSETIYKTARDMQENQ